MTSDQDQVKLNGSGPDVGLGFDYFIRDRSSIGLGVTERFVHYRQPDDPRFREGLNSRSTLINARWNVYFRRTGPLFSECIYFLDLFLLIFYSEAIPFIPHGNTIGQLS